MRTKLTDQEYTVVMKYTDKIKIDSTFDIYDCGETDCWKDWEEYRMVDLQTGFEWLADAIVYPFEHDGMTTEEGEIIRRLIKEFTGKDLTI